MKTEIHQTEQGFCVAFQLTLSIKDDESKDTQTTSALGSEAISLMKDSITKERQSQKTINDNLSGWKIYQICPF